MTRVAPIWIGTSGWVYRHWMGIFYAKGMPSDAQLPFFARHFPTVEVNYSFYKLPEREVFEAWRRQTPPDYLFAVKASRYLTHMKKLKEPEEPLARLMERATGLEEKLGPILFQFPLAWRANLPRLEAFMEALAPYRATGQRFAFEFRHQTWLTNQVHGLLERSDAALCLPVHPNLPLDPRVMTSWTYVRFHAGLHGIGLGEDELRFWAARLDSYRRAGTTVYAYFNNDPGGHALRDGTRLAELLDIPDVGVHGERLDAAA
jgi:uncharacterized protein YecE (DUF72 family)